MFVLFIISETTTKAPINFLANNSISKPELNPDIFGMTNPFFLPFISYYYKVIYIFVTTKN